MTPETIQELAQTLSDALCGAIVIGATLGAISILGGALSVSAAIRRRFDR